MPPNDHEIGIAVELRTNATQIKDLKDALSSLGDEASGIQSAVLKAIDPSEDMSQAIEKRNQALQNVEHIRASGDEREMRAGEKRLRQLELEIEALEKLSRAKAKSGILSPTQVQAMGIVGDMPLAQRQAIMPLLSEAMPVAGQIDIKAMSIMQSELASARAGLGAERAGLTPESQGVKWDTWQTFKDQAIRSAMGIPQQLIGQIGGAVTQRAFGGQINLGDMDFSNPIGAASSLMGSVINAGLGAAEVGRARELQGGELAAQIGMFSGGGGRNVGRATNYSGRVQSALMGAPGVVSGLKINALDSGNPFPREGGEGDDAYYKRAVRTLGAANIETEEQDISLAGSGFVGRWGVSYDQASQMGQIASSWAPVTTPEEMYGGWKNGTRYGGILTPFMPLRGQGVDTSTIAGLGQIGTYLTGGSGIGEPGQREWFNAVSPIMNAPNYAGRNLAELYSNVATPLAKMGGAVSGDFSGMDLAQNASLIMGGFMDTNYQDFMLNNPANAMEFMKSLNAPFQHPSGDPTKAFLMRAYDYQGGGIGEYAKFQEQVQQGFVGKGGFENFQSVFNQLKSDTGITDETTLSYMLSNITNIPMSQLKPIVGKMQAGGFGDAYSKYSRISKVTGEEVMTEQREIDIEQEKIQLAVGSKLNDALKDVTKTLQGMATPALVKFANAVETGASMFGGQTPEGKLRRAVSEGQAAESREAANQGWLGDTLINLPEIDFGVDDTTLMRNMGNEIRKSYKNRTKKLIEQQGTTTDDLGNPVPTATGANRGGDTIINVYGDLSPGVAGEVIDAKENAYYSEPYDDYGMA